MKRRVSIFAFALVLVLAMCAMFACDAETATTYKITVAEAENGLVTASDTEAIAGKEITLTVTADDGYVVSYVKVNGQNVTVKDGKATFPMPPMNVTVESAFVKEGSDVPKPDAHTVAVDSGIVGGKVTVDKKSAVEGEKVTITVAADFGYVVKQVEANDVVVNATEGVYSFDMLNSDVTVSATFVLVDDVITDAAPQTAVEMSAQAYAGETATAKIVIEKISDGLKLVAYVKDGTVLANDGVGLYIGRNAYSQGKLSSVNCAAIVTVEAAKLFKVDAESYKETELGNVTASVKPWVADGKVCGYVAQINLPQDVYAVADETIDELTVLPVVINCDKGDLYNTVAYGDGNVDDPDTYPLLKDDGTLEENYYTYGPGQLGQGKTPIATGEHWDLSQDFDKNDANYANRKAVLDGHDGADNNIAMFRATGKSLYAKATFKLTGMGSDTERWGKFGMMLFNGASQNGVFFYADAWIGENVDVSIENIKGTALGYNVGNGSWGSWNTIPGTDGSFNKETKTITLAMTAYDGMVFMYLNDKFVGQTAINLSDDAVMGFKSFGYNMEVTDYVVIDDENNDEFKSHVEEVVNTPVDVLFLGDSYMDFWGVSFDFGFQQHTAAIASKADIGVGGTQINYWTERAALIKKMYTPAKFVFHIGVNDIDDADTTAEIAFDRFKTMIDVYTEVFPDAEIYWVSLIHNTMFAAKCDEYDIMNEKVSAYAENIDKLHYIDVTNVGMDENGNTRVNMSYDGLHMNKEYGYPLWAKQIMEALGYGDTRTQGTTFGDIEGKHAYSDAWSFSEDGTVANATLGGEQVVWAIDMAYATDFIFTADVKSSGKTFADAWSKIGLTLHNDAYSIFGYIDTADKYNGSVVDTPELRKFCQIVYRPVAAPNGFGIAGDWLWSAQGSGSETDKLIEQEFITLGLAKAGNNIYMLANGKIVATHIIDGIADQGFVAGVMGFNRNIEAKNAKVELGTTDEILLKLGQKAADAELDGVADDAIWTDEVLSNTLSFGDRGEGRHYEVAAVKGTDGIYFYVNIWHSQELTVPAKGVGVGWWEWLNIEFRYGDDQDTQRFVCFEKGAVKGSAGVLVGSYVTEKDGALYKTSVEFFSAYDYFAGYNKDSDKIPVKVLGWVAETDWQTVDKTAFVSEHGFRYQRNVSVAEVTGATISVDKTIAYKGDVVTISITDFADGYKLDKVFVNGQEIVAEDGVYSFVMTDADATVSATFLGRRTVNLDKLVGRVVASSTNPMQGDVVTFTAVDPFTIVKLYVNGQEVVAENGEYKVVVTSDIVVTGDVFFYEDDLVLDGKVDEAYEQQFVTRVAGDRQMTVRSFATENAVWIYTTAITNTNPAGSANFWGNLNFEFYVNGKRFAVNNSNQSPSDVDTFAVTQYIYDNKLEAGKYHHTLEIYISKADLGDSWNGDRMQFNYAWCVSNEVAHVIDCSNARYDASHWWGQATIGGIADADWEYGSGINRPANLFITRSGLQTTANLTPADEKIDGIASEKYGSTWVSSGNENKAKVKVQGFVGTDGLYFLFTIKHKHVSATENGWAANDNIEFVVEDTWTAFTFVDGQLRGSGLIKQGATTRTGEEGNYTTVAEVFIPIANRADVYKVRFGIAGNGFGGWQVGYYFEHYIYVTKDGVGAENVEQIAENINIDGELDDEFWNGVTKYENKNCTSYTNNGAYAKVMAKRGVAGVYIGVELYQNVNYDTQIQGDGKEWWNYLNIEFRFVANGNWDASVQRAICPWNNGLANCDGAYVLAESDIEGYKYKTTFEIFVANEMMGEFRNAEEVPLWIAGVLDKGFAFILDFGQDTTLPKRLTSEGFVQ